MAYAAKRKAGGQKPQQEGEGRANSDGSLGVRAQRGLERGYCMGEKEEAGRLKECGGAGDNFQGLETRREGTYPALRMMPQRHGAFPPSIVSYTAYNTPPHAPQRVSNAERMCTARRSMCAGAEEKVVGYCVCLRICEGEGEVEFCWCDERGEAGALNVPGLVVLTNCAAGCSAAKAASAAGMPVCVRNEGKEENEGRDVEEDNGVD
ncbi:hypothetical protein K438DRAFT_1773918 [Mycena galopus ATCC 62051]|nr:hypothetical protein K438DRAFT_1773918 [Mycena galopus ATCC 62051]